MLKVLKVKGGNPFRWFSQFHWLGARIKVKGQRLKGKGKTEHRSRKVQSARLKVKGERSKRVCRVCGV